MQTIVGVPERRPNRFLPGRRAIRGAGRVLGPRNMMRGMTEGPGQQPAQEPRTGAAEDRREVLEGRVIPSRRQDGPNAPADDPRRHFADAPPPAPYGGQDQSWSAPGAAPGNAWSPQSSAAAAAVTPEAPQPPLPQREGPPATRPGPHQPSAPAAPAPPEVLPGHQDVPPVPGAPQQPPAPQGPYVPQQPQLPQQPAGPGQAAAQPPYGAAPRQPQPQPPYGAAPQQPAPGAQVPPQPAPQPTPYAGPQPQAQHPAQPQPYPQQQPQAQPRPPAQHPVQPQPQPRPQPVPEPQRAARPKPAGEARTPDWGALAEQQEAAGAKRRKVLMLTGGIVAIAVVAGGVATAVVMSGKSSDHTIAGSGPSGGTATTTGTLPPTPSFSSVAPPPPLNPLDYLSSAAKDKEPLTPDSLLPGKQFLMNGRVYVKTATAVTANCPAGARSALAGALGANGCRKLIRATYTSGTTAVTVGVAVFDDPAHALKLQKTAQYIAPLNGGGVKDFCHAVACRMTSNSVGRYAYFAIAGLKDNKTITASDKVALQSANDASNYAFQRLIQRGHDEAAADRSAQ